MELENLKEKIVLLDNNTNDEVTSFIKENFKDYDFSVTSTYDECFEEIDKDNTKIVIVDKDSEDWGYEYFISKVKLTINAPSVIVLSNKVNDALYVNSLYLLGFSSYLITSQENWKRDLHSTIRHIIRNQKLEEINRKLTMRLTEANMMLNDKNKRLDEFCQTVAHDIRGPLGGLIMRLEYLNDKFDNITKERIKDVITTSLGVCERLVSQVQAMYEFAKLGKEASNMEFFDLNELINALIQDLNFSNNKNIKIEIDKFPKIYGSKELVKRLFLNLITNAIKYNDKEEKSIKIGFNGEENLSAGTFAKIYVKDNGNGISKEDLGNVFKLFNRASENNSKKEGLGVGLTVVERVIELHLGKINIESEIGKGTYFKFLLPIEKI
ncbi:MAG: HAMP domain-containing sensor histidine kinase [Bdellovibrionota bacterium]|nr:HAMP domain-containing sensor histidine kinase [Pseudomonadota bacterium]MDY6090443.1 HAMP domain-containing sensor histidine kinase [Bdellovibrionota bacterium]